MLRPKRSLILLVALLLLGVFAARSLAPYAVATLANAAQSASGLTLTLNAAAPAWLTSVCPGFACISARVAPQSDSNNAATTVTFSRLGAAVSPIWLTLLSAALGGAGIVVLGAVVIFAVRLR